jgi:hypothetical protein
MLHKISSRIRPAKTTLKTEIMENKPLYNAADAQAMVKLHQ